MPSVFSTHIDYMNKLALIPNSFGILLAPIWLVVEHFNRLKLLLSVSVQSCSLPQAGKSSPLLSLLQRSLSPGALTKDLVPG